MSVGTYRVILQSTILIEVQLSFFTILLISLALNTVEYDGNFTVNRSLLPCTTIVL